MPETRNRYNVSRETFEKLEAYVDLVLKWNPRINLVSKSSADQIHDRHITDSVQLAEGIESEVDLWADLGSGGGFPGLVLAILSAEKPLARRFILVESDARKSAFLAQVTRLLDLPVTIKTERIEKLAPLDANVLSARALASLNELCGFADRHLLSDGRAVFPKGATFQHEIEEAKASWSFDLAIKPSVTNPDSAILHLWNIKHV